MLLRVPPATTPAQRQHRSRGSDRAPLVSRPSVWENKQVVAKGSTTTTARMSSARVPARPDRAKSHTSERRPCGLRRPTSARHKLDLGEDKSSFGAPRLPELATLPTTNGTTMNATTARAETSCVQVIAIHCCCFCLGSPSLAAPRLREAHLRDRLAD